MEASQPVQPISQPTSIKQILWLLLLLPLFLAPLGAWYIFGHIPGINGASANRHFWLAYAFIMAAGLLSTLAVILYAIKAAHAESIEPDKRSFWAIMIIFFFGFIALPFWYLYIWHPEKPKKVIYPIIATLILYGAVYGMFGWSLHNLVAKEAAIQKQQQQQAEQAEQYDGLIKAAHDAWQAGDYNGAVTNGQAAVAKASTDQQRAVGYYWMGVGYNKLQNFEGAKKAATVAVSLDPKYGPPHVTLGSIALGNNDLATARSEANTAIALDPKYAWGYNLLGIVEYQSGHKALAIADEQKAIQLDSNQVVFQQNLNSFEGKY